jgi:hypothetical protein
MSISARLRHRGCPFIATLVSAAFFWTLLLSASPQLHARIHPDGNRTEHTCAVTLIATGSYDHAAPPLVVSQPQFTLGFSEIAAPSSNWVQPLFLAAHIFEHAPPARG